MKCIIYTYYFKRFSRVFFRLHKRYAETAKIPDFWPKELNSTTHYRNACCAPIINLKSC